MTKICFSPGQSEADAAEALRSLSSRLAADTPVMALAARSGGGDVLFASAAIMRLFGVARLVDLEARIFSQRSGCEAAERLGRLAESFPLDGPARLERLHFAGARHPRIFLCRRVRAPARPLLLAAALDMPKELRASPAPAAARRPPAAEAVPPDLAPTRFLWRSDAAGHLIEIGPALATTLGEAPDAFPGQALARLVASFDPDKGMALARLFDERASFSGFLIDWPLAGDDGVAPVSLAGSPAFDRARTFIGFRGFGLVHAPRSAAGNIVALRAARRASPTGPLGGDAPGGAVSLGPAAMLGRIQREFTGARPAGPARARHDGDAPAPGEIAFAAFDALPIGALVRGDAGPVFANRFLLDALGAADMAGAEASGAFEQIFAALRSGRADSLTLRDANGQAVFVWLSRRALRRAGGRLELISLIPRPAEAERADADAEARRSQREARELAAILETATDGVAVIDSAGKILSVNRSCEALFGTDASELRGRHFTTLFAPESRERADAYFAGMNSDVIAGVFNDGRDLVGVTRQGGAAPIFMTLGKIGAASDHEGQRYCALLRDMTHWKKVERDLENARREAERASALKSDFLAKVSHEIRTPLNAIMGFAEVMLEERFGPVGNDRYKDYLKDIHASGGLVMSLVNDLLDLSKIEAGKLELAFEPVDVNRIVSECVSIMQPQASAARVLIRLSLAPQLPHIYADERSVRQISLNLLSNAIKFTEAGGQVVVSTALSDDNCAALRIRDTGIGMSEEDLGVALRPFGQVSRGSGGTGLGLPLTKALVEANRAKFAIRSKPAEGTLVEVVFASAKAIAARK